MHGDIMFASIIFFLPPKGFPVMDGDIMCASIMFIGAADSRTPLWICFGYCHAV